MMSPFFRFLCGLSGADLRAVQSFLSAPDATAVLSREVLFVTVARAEFLGGGGRDQYPAQRQTVAARYDDAAPRKPYQADVDGRAIARAAMAQCEARNAARGASAVADGRAVAFPKADNRKAVPPCVAAPRMTPEDKRLRESVRASGYLDHGTLPRDATHLVASVADVELGESTAAAVARRVKGVARKAKVD